MSISFCEYSFPNLVLFPYEYSILWDMSISFCEYSFPNLVLFPYEYFILWVFISQLSTVSIWVSHSVSIHFPT